MGYREHLWRMLKPLGVYSDTGYSGGELAALAVALDQMESHLDMLWRETAVMTAEGSGLTLAESIFPMLPGTDAASRRAALQKLWQADNLCASAQDIQTTLEGCGVSVTLAATGNFTAMVAFAELLTIRDEPVFQFWLLEQLLPCHLVVTVRVSYVDVSTGETVQERNTLDALRQRTQTQWEQLLGAYM